MNNGTVNQAIASYHPLILYTILSTDCQAVTADEENAPQQTLHTLNKICNKYNFTIYTVKMKVTVFTGRGLTIKKRGY